MTVLLAWQNDLDASAALVIDGTVAGAVAEERFTRFKQQTGFPQHAVSYLLDQAGLQVADIDEWPYGFFQGTNANDLLPGLCARVAEQAADPEAVDVMVRRLTTEHQNDTVIRDDGYREAAAFGVPMSLVRAYEHHPSHAWSAFAFAGFDEALVVTADGRGDRKSITVSRGDASGLAEVEWYSSIDSIGHIYSQVTAALGFRTNRHEGKITGLAGYGSPAVTKPMFAELIGWTGERIRARPGRHFIPSDQEIPESTLRRFQAFSRQDLAAGVQALVEDLLCRLVSINVRRTGLRRVAVAGGVFANVQINRRIRELPEVDAVFVAPNMGDGGLPLGAAAAAHHRLTGSCQLNWSDMFLGPMPGQVCDEPALRFADPAATIEWLCGIIAAGACVGFVNDRAEFGPRALCHRSILCDASNPAINDVLNARLKRTEFMPFAPILTDQAAACALVGWSPSDRCAPFMTMAYEVTADFARVHPAVVHVDGTARPQVVTQQSDHFVYQLLEQYEQRTGRTALINTSFNVHEEPIIQSLEDGLRALRAGAVDWVCTQDRAWQA